MGKFTVKFCCHSTGHCCTDVVCLPTPWDVIRIAEGTGESPCDFVEFLAPDEIDEVEEDDPTWLEVKGERFIMALVRSPKSGCYFLERKTKKCGIYEHRPILCRMYPFKIEETKDGEYKGFSLHEDVGCPRFRDGKVDVQELYELYLDDGTHQTDYAGLVKMFNRREYPGKRPEDFIEMFAVGAAKSA